MLKAFCERLVEDIRPAYAAAAAVLTALLALAFGLPGLLAAPLAIPLLLEAAARVLFRLAYGPMYWHRVRPWLLKDHPVYGFGVREGVDTEKIDFLLFEKYFFPIGTKTLLDPEENRRARLPFRTNSRGCRGPEFSPEKAPGTLRVICVGDSTTIGHGVPDGAPWPARLEQGLRARGLNAEVINAGSNGWDSYQELLRVKHELLSYAPDALVLHQGWNEEFNYTSLDLGRNYKPKVARGYWDKYFFYTNPSDWRPRSSLSLILLIRCFVKDYFLRRDMAFSNPRRWDTLDAPSYLRDWYDNLAEIVALCEERGVRVLLVDYPCLVSRADSPAEREVLLKGTRLNPLHARYQALSKARVESVLKIASEFVPLADGVAPFLRLDAARRRTLFSDEIHLTSEGEALLGETVAEALAPLLRAGPGSPLKPGQSVASMRLGRERAGVNAPEIAREIDEARSSLSIDPGRGKR